MAVVCAASVSRSPGWAEAGTPSLKVVVVGVPAVEYHTSVPLTVDGSAVELSDCSVAVTTGRMLTPSEL